MFRLCGLRANRLIAVVFFVFLSIDAAADEVARIRVGVLAYGTVNWELDTVKYHGLDRQQGVDIDITRLSGKNASAIALQGGSVDAIVTDWIWVSRQRNSGADYSFVPHSTAVGGLMVRPDSAIGSLKDLRGRKIGIAGGPVDKSWLMLRAYAQKTIGTDLEQLVEPVFAAPPLLNKIILKGDVPAALNFWHYTARLKAAGMTELVSVEALLPVLGIERKPPLIGWVFSEAWAASNPRAINGFLKSLRAAKEILANSDREWERLRPLTRADSDEILFALRDAYRSGIPASFNDEDIAAARRLYSSLEKFGGRKLVGDGSAIAEGTFWPGFRY